MLPFQERQYEKKITSGPVVLVGDIGGTNSNFGIFTVDAAHPELFYSIHFKSQQITDFTLFMNELVEYLVQTYGFIIQACCLAAAGVINHDGMSCKLTNLSLSISTPAISAKTGIKKIVLANDFQVIGYGIDILNQKDLVPINQGNVRRYATRTIIGAGTGLGKSILYWSQHRNRYMPLSSEGGHADCAVYTQEEFDLIAFVQKQENRTYPISWEDVLSGNGIRRLYTFFSSKCPDGPCKHASIGHAPHPDEIFASRDVDEHCRQTVDLYTKLYARCAKNIALDALALGGVYIAGGIAAKNIPLFQQSEFMQEFVRCDKYETLLADIPIFIVADYNVSLYGAAVYLQVGGVC